MVTTNRDDLAERIRLLRSHGMTTLTWDRHRGHAASYDVVATGFNYRLDEIHSALGLAQLGKLLENNRRRADLVAHLRAELTGLPGLTVPFSVPAAGSQPVYHIFPVILEPAIDRAAFMAHLRGQGIQSSIHYPPIHQFSAFRGGANRRAPADHGGCRTARIHPAAFPHYDRSADRAGRGSGARRSGGVARVRGRRRSRRWSPHDAPVFHRQPRVHPHSAVGGPFRGKPGTRYT